jgi:hypothetical protein
MPCLCTEWYVKTAHPQYVDVAIRRIVSVEGSRQETGVHSAVDSLEVILWHSVEIVQISMRRHVSFSTALVPQLQLWHLHWLVFVEFVGGLHSRVP